MNQMVDEPLRTIFSRLDAVYANGEVLLTHALERGERGDTLADFIHFEIKDIAGHLAAGETSEAARLASDALNTARGELNAVARAMERLRAADSAEHVLRAADAAYHGGESRIAERIEPGERGDTLADFIHFEIMDVTAGSKQPAMDAFVAIKAGVRELDSCIHELEHMVYAPRSRPQP